MVTFAQQLKQWRQLRRLSQLQLADRVDVSLRHASFLESGRALPSRDMVRRFADALDLPLAESNALFVSAGFAPPFTELRRSISEMPQVGKALSFILGKQEPYPAIVIDGGWNITARNEATRKFFAPFHAGYDAPPGVADNAMLTVFHPGALRRYIVDWRGFAAAFLQLLHRDVGRGSSPAARLLTEVLGFPDVASLSPGLTDPEGQFPLMTMKLQKDDYKIAFFSTFTHFALPTDVDTEQLRIECFFPADAATEALAHELSKATS